MQHTDEHGGAKEGGTSTRAKGRKMRGNLMMANKAMEAKMRGAVKPSGSTEP